MALLMAFLNVQGGMVAITIPLSEGSRWTDLNCRPAVYETAALPLSYIGIFRNSAPSIAHHSGTVKLHASVSPPTINLSVCV